MKPRCASPTALLLLTLSALSVSVSVAAGRCDAPFKTLSSDCRGADYGANVLCVVNDQRAGQPSPCKTGIVRDPRMCAVRTSLSCDLLTYKVNYKPTQARFEIKFAGDVPLLTTDSSAGIAPPPRSPISGGSRVLAAAGSGSRDVPAPPTTTKPPEGIRVDHPVPTPPPPTVTPVATPVTTRPPVPTPPQATRVDTLPPPPPTPEPGGFTPAPAMPIDYNGGNAIPSESNEFVEAIGVLRLDPALTEVRIVGGSTEVGTRGNAVKLTIDPQMLTYSPQVTTVWIANCNIGDQLATSNLLGGMPKGLTELNLPNTMMRTEPSDLSALQNLRSLTMGPNYLSTFSSKVALPKLAMLDLRENELASFDAYLPALVSLYLNKNKLTSIPAIVYSMDNLQELYLAENPIAALVVSDTQFLFLNAKRVKINKPSTTPPRPVIYVAGPIGESPPLAITGLVLDSKDVDLSSAVAVPVGSLVDLQGFPVWRLSNALYAVFRAQQDVLAKSSIVIGGAKAQSYEAKAAGVALEASKVPSGTTPSVGDSIEPTDGVGASPGAANAGDSHSNIMPSTSNGNKEQAKGTRDSPTFDSQSNTTASGTSHKTLILSLTVVAGIAVLAIIILCVRHRRRSSVKGTENSASDVTTPRDGSSPGSFQAFGNAKSKSARDSLGSFGSSLVAHPDADVSSIFSSRRVRAGDLEDVRVIGSSSVGVVWLVKLRGSRLLASKRLIEAASTDQRMAEFVSEIVIAADLDHPSIIHLVGIAWTSRTDLQALFDYMPNGDLQTYLGSTAAESLSWSSAKLKLAMEIVEALVYTHSFNPPLLHRDLRTCNVLLDEDMAAKLSNFGSARFASEQNTMTTDGVGSSRWLAPEILSGSTDYDAPSDMYAFGVVLTELNTHKTPYEDVRDMSGNTMAEAGLIERVARGELRPSMSATCPEAIRELANRCLSQDPLTRPTAMQVAYELRILMRATSVTIQGSES